MLKDSMMRTIAPTHQMEINKVLWAIVKYDSSKDPTYHGQPMKHKYFNMFGEFAAIKIFAYDIIRVFADLSKYVEPGLMPEYTDKRELKDTFLTSRAGWRRNHTFLEFFKKLYIPSMVMWVSRKGEIFLPLVFGDGGSGGGKKKKRKIPRRRRRPPRKTNRLPSRARRRRRRARRPMRPCGPSRPRERAARDPVLPTDDGYL